jgi:thiol:disulfide interchange protein DsbD
MIASTFAQAQDKLEPVIWDFTYDKVADAENTYLISLTATIEEGWYVYSQHLEEGGPLPTTISFIDSTSTNIIATDSIVVEEVGKLKSGYDELFEMNISKYANQVSFQRIVKTADSPAKLTGAVRFMACEATRCLPPRSVPFTFEF